MLAVARAMSALCAQVRRFLARCSDTLKNAQPLRRVAVERRRCGLVGDALVGKSGPVQAVKMDSNLVR
jgi:hypothetical protein